MSDSVFISYAREDRARARQIAHRLEERAYSVWWDRKILAGRSFDEVIQEALASSDCVVVLWSETSVGSDWVKEEAEQGKRRGILIPVLVDDVEIPIGFSRIQAVNLTDWNGEPEHPEFQQFLASIESLISRAGTTAAHQEPRPATRAPSASVARADGERKPGSWRLGILAAGGLLVAVFGMFLWAQRSQNPCETIFQQTSNQLSVQVSDLSREGALVLGAAKIQELSELAQITALNLKTCCILAHADKIDGDQFLTCKNGAATVQDRIDRLGELFQEARAARSDGSTMLFRQKVYESERVIEEAREIAASLGGSGGDPGS